MAEYVSVKDPMGGGTMKVKKGSNASRGFEKADSGGSSKKNSKSSSRSGSGSGGVDLDNEAKYLASFMGGPGESWARQQAASYGLKPYDLVPFMKSNAPTVDSPAGTQSLIPDRMDLTSLVPEPPELDIPRYREYEPEPFEYKPPSYSITANKGDTTFIPTSRAKDRWQQQEAMKAGEHLNAYNALVNRANMEQDQWYRGATLGLQGQQMMMPYLYPTVSDNMAQNRWQQEFDFGQQQYANSPEAQPWYLPGMQQQMNLGNQLTQAQITNALRPPSSSGGGGGGGGGATTPKLTQTERQNQATAEAMQAVDKALKGGASPEQVRASIVAQTPQLIADGVDPTEIDSYLTTVSTTMQKTQQDTEKQRLQQRPFWQKGIDAILPWGQFR